MSDIRNTHIFLIDNFDSFTYNLVDEMRRSGYPLTIYRNNVDAGFIFEQIEQCREDVIVMLSPGPGTPAKAGSMPELLRLIAGKYPVIGICLGHQAIVEYYGGEVGRSDQVKHGKSSLINHCADKMFANLPSPLPVARYHSLMATQVPENLSIVAEYNDIPMAVYNDQDKILGFQFHPESILTSHGSQLLSQSINHLSQRA
jgi:anthranilate synthase component 2